MASRQHQVERNISQGRYNGFLKQGHSEWVTCCKFFLVGMQVFSTCSESQREDNRGGVRRDGNPSPYSLVTCSYDGKIRFWDLSGGSFEMFSEFSPK